MHIDVSYVTLTWIYAGMFFIGFQLMCWYLNKLCDVTELKGSDMVKSRITFTILFLGIGFAFGSTLIYAKYYV